MIRLNRAFAFVVYFCFGVLGWNKVGLSNVGQSETLCGSLFDDVVVDTVINYGNVDYKSVPKSKILNMDKLHNPQKTMGVTVAGARVSYELETVKKKVDNGFCIGIKKIKFFVGYPELSVFIDEKYKEGSCQYEAIKKHEKGHVAIYQKELKYYGDLILSDLQWIGKNVKPMFFQKNVSDNAVRSVLDGMIAKSSVMAVMEKLDSTLKNKNAEHDNEAEYQRVKSECDSW